MAVVLLGACSSKDDGEEGGSGDIVPPEQQQAPIDFSSMAATRAATPLDNKYKSFGVWAWKGMSESDMSPLMMHGAAATDPALPYFVYNDVKYAGNGSSQRWGYDMESVNGRQQYLRFWDLAYTHYDFYAYSPYNSNTAYPATSASGTMANAMNPTSAHKLSIAGITANFDVDKPGANIDWLWAKTRRTMTTLKDEDLIDPTNIAPKPVSRTATVPLAFHHILAKVKFCVKYRNKGKVTMTGYVKDFSITADGGFAQTATFTDAAAGQHFSSISKTAPAYSFPMVQADPIACHATADEDNDPVDITAWMAVVPEQTYTMQVRITITEAGVDREMTTTIPVPEDDQWQMDKQYIYTLIIDQPGSELNFAIQVADWTDGGTITPSVMTGW